MSKMKAFQMDDCTWYAAETVDQAVQAYKEDTGEDVDTEDGFPAEVSDEALDREIPEMDENERPTSKMTCMRVFLNEASDPGFLASTEW